MTLDPSASPFWGEQALALPDLRRVSPLGCQLLVVVTLSGRLQKTGCGASASGIVMPGIQVSRVRA